MGASNGENSWICCRGPMTQACPRFGGDRRGGNEHEKAVLQESDLLDVLPACTDCCSRCGPCPDPNWRHLVKTKSSAHETSRPNCYRATDAFETGVRYVCLDLQGQAGRMASTATGWHGAGLHTASSHRPPDEVRTELAVRPGGLGNEARR